MFQVFDFPLNQSGFDLVEVAPPYDPTGMTGQVAARILLDLLSYVLKEKEIIRKKEYSKEKEEIIS
ncbi:arginase family protein [Cytobacillus citreus]|uniref:arginase family protein n=1 Tax=Cytobacillus citreus TaxID=2833586 RepID=UPI0030844EC7